MRQKLGSMLSVAGRILLFVGLLVLPSLIRLGVLYRRPYTPRAIPRPNLAEVSAPEIGSASFQEREALSREGMVVIDRAHGNAIEDGELNVLLARLTARGIESVMVASGEDLGQSIRTAVALVVISPHRAFSEAESKAIKQFVDQGGRLLLVADPSRYVVEMQEDEIAGETYAATSDVVSLNALASVFGLSFADDYLYNTVQNGGNYQYVVMRDFAESPLTADLQEVVFYSAHSLLVSERALISGDENTISSLNQQNTHSTVMALGGGGQVLAVGDLTFMTEPYSATADNGQLIANIADFVASATRTFGLTQFPLFFGEQIDLISVLPEDRDGSDMAISVEQVALLQRTLDRTQRKLYWHSMPDPAHDTFYLGRYAGLDAWPQVRDILAAQGISVTIHSAERAPVRTPSVRPALTVTVEPTTTVPALQDWIELPGLGRIDAKQTALFYQNESGERQELIALAFDPAGIEVAVERLVSGDFSGCAIDEDWGEDPTIASLALCPVNYVSPDTETSPPPDTSSGNGEVDPEPESGSQVLVVSDDDGQGVYEWWTSAYHLYDVVANAGYEPLVWSTDYDGAVTPDLIASVDIVLWCTGDYQAKEGNPSIEELSMLQEYVSNGGRLLLIGAFLGSPEGRQTGLVRDIVLDQAEHPLAAGFQEGQVIALERFSATEDYAPYLLQDAELGDVVWRRGPESELAGEAVLVTIENEPAGGRLALMGVPLYLLPYEAGNTLGNNLLLWLVEKQ